MAKRLTDSEKWMDSWFRRLPTNCKILWVYILDRCDLAGVWEIDLELFELLSGSKVKMVEFQEKFADRAYFFDNGRKVWIRKFIEFQNGKLDPESKSPIIGSVLKCLRSHNLLDASGYPIDTLSTTLSDRVPDTHKEKERVKEEEEGKEKEGAEVTEQSDVPELSELKQQFDEARKKYPGTNRGPKAEWAHFLNKHGKRKAEIIPLLLPGIAKYCRHLAANKTEAKYIKNFQGWITEERWATEYPEWDTKKQLEVAQAGMTEEQKLREWRRLNVT